MLADRLKEPGTCSAAIAELDAMVEVADGGVTITMSVTPVAGLPERHTIVIPARLARRGHELRLTYPPADHSAMAEPDVKLVGLLAKAEAAHRELLEQVPVEKTRRAHLAHLARLARLRFLAPDIVTAILEGRHPVELSARKLLRADTIPMGWVEQRIALGFA